MSVCEKCNEQECSVFNLQACKHLVCHSCLYEYLSDFSNVKIKCPIDGCDKYLRDPIIRKCLSDEKLKFYDQLCYDKSAVKCLIKNCFYFVSYTKDEDGHFVCPVCQQPNCLVCKRLHHIDDHCKSIIDYDPRPFKKEAKIHLRDNRKNQREWFSEEHDLAPNSDSFECKMCSDFILPRAGIKLRNCLHQFCRNCLDSYFSYAENLKNLTCPVTNCAKKLSDREAKAFIGEEKMIDLSLKLVKSRMFSCQTPECRGMWNFDNFRGKYKCPYCKVENCGECKDIHGEMPCSEFQKSSRFKDAQKCLENMNNTTHIKCKACNTVIIKNGRCNALRCPTCKLQVCAYSGQEIGPTGCKCTRINRCVDGCTPGCIPDGNTPYELRLKKYFETGIF